MFNVVKRFLDDYTLGKIFIFKHGSKKWFPKMIENIDASQLPIYFGGSQVGEGNDEKCTHKVNKAKSIR